MKRERLPVFLLTGFLGSGKTTLLARWLRQPSFSDSAVIINEAGAVQIDGVLVGRASENVRVLDGGCVCCAVLDDLGETIEALLAARAREEVPVFSRLLVETSGLADPGPISASLMCDPRLSTRVRLAGTIAVVDGMNGPENLRRYPEARSQLAHAEHVVMTKADLLDAEDRMQAEEAVRRVNAHATRRWSSRLDPAAPPLADFVREGPSFVPVASSPRPGIGPGRRGGAAHAHAHASLSAHAFRFGQPIDGASLIEAMDLMEQLFEGEIVRSKSLFFDEHSHAGYAVHSVHGSIDAPEEIDDLDVAATGIVVFTHTVPRERLKQILSPFVPLRD